MKVRLLAPSLGLAALLTFSAPARAFEVCMEGGPWLAYYLKELDEGNFNRVLELTAPRTGRTSAEVQKTLEQAWDKGLLDPGAMAKLTIEGDCTIDVPGIEKIAADHDLHPDSILAYRLGDAFVVLTIVGPPDWFNFVAASLKGL